MSFCSCVDSYGPQNPIRVLVLAQEALPRTVYPGEDAQTPPLRPIMAAFDTLPLFIAILVYTPFWPGRFTPRVEGAQRINMDKVEMENLQLEAGGSSEYGCNRWAGGSR